MRFIDQVRAISNNIDHEDYFEQEVKPLIVCNATRGLTHALVPLPNGGANDAAIRSDLVIKLLEAEGFDPPIVNYRLDGIDLEIYW